MLENKVIFIYLFIYLSINLFVGMAQFDSNFFKGSTVIKHLKYILLAF